MLRAGLRALVCAGALVAYGGAALATSNAGTAVPSSTPTATPTPVPLGGSATGFNGVTGDCNENSVVSIDELVRGVNIALERQTLDNCPAFDADGNGRVTIDELIRAVNAALVGAPVDKDGDGFTESQGDCDDANPAIHPQAAEVCNGSDDNCNGPADEGLGQTTCGVGICQHSVPNCVAGTPQVCDPLAGSSSEICNNGDDDCDGEIDEGNVCGDDPLPPDPATVAPPVAQGVATTIGAATEFLYTGDNPIQRGVAPGTIEPQRAAVLRGKVLTRDAAALSGVSITILDHPELGRTLSRVDGMFDLAVNGGGPLTVNYEKTGFCPVQRQVAVPWQDYAMAPDVVMTTLDPIVTPVALGSTSVMQMAHGSMQSDANGTRTAMMLFMPGTSASLVLPDGTTQSVSSLHVRATELTVGANGPAAMPGVLPPTSAYTYCVELSADEAISAGAMTVAFSQPVINYVENFLDFPVGIAVPTGFYDRQKAAWVPSQNGRVVKILSITSGFADLDTDGDSVADDGLGITSEERQHLASLYAAGQTLWRVPIPHFSAVDQNWSYLPEDAITPGQSGAGPVNDDLLEDPSICQGCVIEMENQVLGDSVAVVGTPYTLNYRSDREPGRLATRSFTLIGPSVPASLQRIGLNFSVAGRTTNLTFSPAPNQQFTFVWDRQDAYGRTLLGGQPLVGSIDYEYPVNYASSSTDPAFASAGGAVLLDNPGRGGFIVSQPFTTVIGEGLTDARVIGLGGWTLSVHHFFDPVAKVMQTGDGRRRRADSLSRIIRGVLEQAGPGDAGRLTPALAVGPDGSVYFARSGSASDHRLRRLAPDGTETVIAGGGTAGPPDFGDGGPATQATLRFSPQNIAVGPDGSVYIVDFTVIRRVGPDGIIRRVAGRHCTAGSCPPSGPSGPDGSLATEIDLRPIGIAVGPDSTLYLSEFFSTFPFVTRVRRVGTDGIITTVAGTSQSCPTSNPTCGDGGPANAAPLRGANDVAVGPDGSLYIADVHRIRRVAPDGIMLGFAGSGRTGFAGDGGAATDALLCAPLGMAFAPDGSLSFADSGSDHIRRVGSDGIITTIAGSGKPCFGPGSAHSGDGGPALAASLSEPRSVALAPDGSLYVNGGGRIRRIGTALPGVSQTDFSVASKDGAELYVFDRDGRHLRTLDALTGATLFELGYDAEGRLTQVIEKTGDTDNVTTIVHDGAGNPTAIIGPFGQQTTLAVDANGFLASITNPATEQTQFTSNPSGLLASKTDPRGKTTTFMFDPEGRLFRDADPAGGTQDIEGVAVTNQLTVTRTTALGRATTYQTENLPGSIQRRTITAPDGTQSESTENIGAATTHITSSDGAISDATLSADPRFGIQAPVTASFSLQFPSSLQLTGTSTRSAVLANSADPLSLVSLTESTTVDSRTAVSTYTAATRTFVNTTPAGRIQTVTLDALGRFVDGQFGNLDPVHLGYDVRGRVESMSVGSGVNTRSLSFAYDAQGFLATITDPIGRTALLGYDAAGRVTSKTLPDGRVVSLGYDAAGNLTSVTPPGRPAYIHGYSDRNELTLFSPPAVPGSEPTTIAYDADFAVTNISRAGIQAVSIAYDAAGRPVTRQLTSGGGPTTTDTFGYDSAGRTSNVLAASGVNFSYDYDGVLPTGVNWSGPVVGSVARTYDQSLRLASQSVNGTNMIAFSYDNDGLLTGAGDLVIVRDPQNGLGTGATLGAITSSRMFNGLGEITNYTANANASTLYGSSYVRNGIGRIAQKVETIGGVTDTYTYAYDTPGQLTNVAKNGVTIESYAYDANGNRTNATVGGVTVSATYDDQDRLTQYDSATFTNNGAGDLTSKTTGGQTTTYDYDPLGNLLGVTLPDGTAITYLVDGLDRRVGRRVNGTLVQGLLYHDLLRPVAELDGAGAVVSRFVYSGGSVPAYLIKGGDSFRMITDQIGSVRLVVNASTGAIVQRLDYDSFGNVLLDTNPGLQPFGFAGGIYDPATKLVRFGTRDYDSETGRWTAQDSLGFAGNDHNLYRYCLNDPVNLLDPAGLDNWDAAVGFIEQMNEELAITINPLLGLQLLLDSALNAGVRQLGFDPGPTMREITFHSLPTTADRKSEDYATGELAGVCVGVVGQLASGAALEKAAALAAAEGAETLARQGRIAERLAAMEGRQVNLGAAEAAAADARNAGRRYAIEIEKAVVELAKGWKTGGGGSGFGVGH